MASFKNKCMTDCTIRPSQNQEWSRLTKWEGESVVKVLTVTGNYIQSTQEYNLVLCHLFLLILFLSEYCLLLEEMPIFL